MNENKPKKEVRDCSKNLLAIKGRRFEKPLVIAILLVAIIGVVSSQSVYAQTTPTSTCHWWNWNCHNQNPGYGQGTGTCYASQYCQGQGYGQYPYQCASYAGQYPNTQYCQGYGSYPSGSYPSYPPSYYPSNQYPTYPQQQSTFVQGISGLESSSNIGITLQTGQGCSITLLGGPNVYLIQYLNQQVSFNGVASGITNSYCPYTQIVVSNITPLQAQQQVAVQETTTAAPSITTTTVTQSTTSTQIPLATPTPDYSTTALILGGLAIIVFGALGAAIVLRKPRVGVPPEAPIFCLKCGTQLPNRQMKFCGNCGSTTGIS